MGTNHADIRIIDKAVDIWKEALSNPIYQNTTPKDGEVHIIHTVINGLLEKRPKNNTPEVLEKFGQKLKAILTTPRESGWYPSYLDVDYSPCSELQAAAIYAGLTMQFPVKTCMEIHDDHVSFSMGYGTPRTYHYMLGDGRWLITDLRIPDLHFQAFIDFIEKHGLTPFARIEEAA